MQFFTDFFKRVSFRADVMVKEYYKLVKKKRLGRLMSTSF